MFVYFSIDNQASISTWLPLTDFLKKCRILITYEFVLDLLKILKWISLPKLLYCRKIKDKR